MQKHTTDYPILKQIEQLVWRQLQETFSVAMKSILEDMDKQIAEERDKKRYRLLAKRKTTLVSLFGEIEGNGTITVTERKVNMSFSLIGIWNSRGQVPSVR